MDSDLDQRLGHWAISSKILEAFIKIISNGLNQNLWRVEPRNLLLSR